MRTTPLATTLAVTASLTVVDSACATSQSTSEPGRSKPAATATVSPSGQVSAGRPAWERVVPGGDCECADGSEFAFFERRADPTKVVFFLDGCGACVDAETCAFTGLGTPGEENYDWKVTDDPADEGGIFEFARADNPLGGLQLPIRALLHR
jgi:hypothetical protein